MSKQVSIERMRVIADKLRGAGFAPVSVEELADETGYEIDECIEFHGRAFYRDGSCDVPDPIADCSPFVLRAWALASELWLDTPDSEVTG